MEKFQKQMGEVYEFNGKTAQINYNLEEHEVTIHSPQIGVDFSQLVDKEKYLLNLGIKTRLLNLTETARNYISFKIHPLAGVTLIKREEGRERQIIEPLKQNTFEVRGREIYLDYNSELHQLIVYSFDIKWHLAQDKNPQKVLEDLGIYTRVDKLVDFSNDHAVFTLKPAASVELRDFPEEGSTLLSRPIGKQIDGSSISKRRGKYGYTVTCGLDTLEKIGLEDKTQAAMFVELDEGNLCLRVKPQDTSHSLTTRVESTGVLGVPTGLASAADLDGHGVNWDVGDDGQSLYGRTTNTPKKVEFPEDLSDVENAHPADKHFVGTISQVVQEEYEYQGKERTQTHFTAYVKSGHLDGLGWGELESETITREEEILKDYIDIEIVNINGRASLSISNDIRDKNIKEVIVDKDGTGEVKSAPCVRRLYKNKTNKQTTFNFPHSLAHSMEFNDEWESKSKNKKVASGKKVLWAVSGSKLLGYPLSPEEYTAYLRD